MRAGEIPVRGGWQSLLQRVEKVGGKGVRVRHHRDVDGGKRLVVHAPAIGHRGIERAADDGRFDRRLGLGIVGATAQIAGEIEPVEADDQIGFGDKGALARRKAVLVGMFSQFVFMPFCAWVLGVIFSLTPTERIGLIIVGCTPGGTTSVGSDSRASVSGSEGVAPLPPLSALLRLPAPTSSPRPPPPPPPPSPPPLPPPLPPPPPPWGLWADTRRWRL